MSADLGELLRAERAALAENPGGDHDFADVVHPRSHAQALDVGVVPSQPRGQTRRQVGDAGAVRRRRGVARGLR